MTRKNAEKLIQTLETWEGGLARLGECIVQFQQIDHALSICISAMIGRSREVGEIVTCEMSFRAKVSVYSALFLHTFGKQSLPEEIVDLVQRLHWAEQQRNTMVHSLWDASEQFPGRIQREKRAIRKKAYSISEEHLTLDELDDLNRSLEGVVTDLFYLTSKHLPGIGRRLRWS